MTLKDFLDAAYALFVDEYRKGGMDLLSAVDEMKQWAAGDGKPVEKSSAEPAPNTADSLAQLNSMMAAFK